MWFERVSNTINLRREVTKSEAEDFASANGLKYIETSAKANINVKNAFMELTQTIYNNATEGVIESRLGVS